LQEGQVWEAFMYAAAKKVDNIISTIDYNGQQIDGSTDNVLSLGNLHAKLEAFGWTVLEEKNGNDLEAVIAILEKAKQKQEKKNRCHYSSYRNGLWCRLYDGNSRLARKSS
jgi:transketolase